MIVDMISKRHRLLCLYHPQLLSPCLCCLIFRKGNKGGAGQHKRNQVLSSLSEEQRKERRRQQSRESRKRLKTAKDANKVRIEDLDAMKLSVANLEKTGALKDTRIILLEAENTLLKEMLKLLKETQVLQAVTLRETSCN